VAELSIWQRFRLLGLAVRLVRLRKMRFAVAFLLSSAMIVFDGAGIGLAIVLIDGIQAGTHVQSSFASLPLFGTFAGYFSDLSGSHRLQLVAVLLAGLAVARGVVTYARNMSLRRFEYLTDKTIRATIFENIMSGEVKSEDDQTASWHLNLLTSFPGQAAAATGRVVIIASGLVTLAIAIGYVTLISWQLTLLAIPLLSIALVGTQYVTVVPSSRAGAALNKFMVDFYNFIMDSVYGLSMIRTFVHERNRTQNFHRLLRRYVGSNLDLQRWASISEPLFTAGLMISLAILFFVGATVIENEREKIPLLISFVLIISRLAGPVSSLNEGVNYIVGQSDAVRIVAAVLRNAPPIRSPNDTSTMTIDYGLAMEGVSFKYRFDRPDVLSKIDLEIKKGAFVAIVGSSGCGKTTMLRLLSKMLEPTAGRVLVDGKDLRTVDGASWRNIIGVVPQESFMFNDTIYQNLRVGKDDATDDELIRAAKAAHAHEFIAALADGYHTIIGDRGSQLSGGQLQRLAIARALVRNPQLILMDEATSNLDTESEIAIKRAINELAGRSTIVVVAHRLSTVMAADHIYVVDDGRVAESGSHRELLRRGGIYSKLFADSMSA
jgi:ABC-type multidrug transport system fused ATPase/permease subunit